MRVIRELNIKLKDGLHVGSTEAPRVKSFTVSVLKIAVKEIMRKKEIMKKICLKNRALFSLNTAPWGPMRPPHQPCSTGLSALLGTLP